MTVRAQAIIRAAAAFSPTASLLLFTPRMAVTEKTLPAMILLLCLGDCSNHISPDLIGVRAEA